MTITFKAQLTEDVINKVSKITIGKKVHKYVGNKLFVLGCISANTFYTIGHLRTKLFLAKK